MLAKQSSINDFEEWLHETEILQYLTNLDKKKQGPVTYIFLDENKRNACDGKVKDLKSDDGVDILLLSKLKNTVC